MRRQLMMLLAVAVLAGLGAKGMALAEEKAAAPKAPDQVVMDSKVYAKHTKPLVTLTHKKHGEEYKLSCGSCHHKYQDGKNVWKETDEVEKCDACHAEAKAPKGNNDAPKLSKADKIKTYHYSAIHENCVGCHKDLKKAAKPTGPVTCKDCHVKK